MNQKKTIQYCICTVLCFVLCAIPAFAASIDPFSLPDSDDFAEIQALSTDICGWVNSLIEDNDDGVPLVTPEQLDFSKAYRVDVDSTMFKQDVSTEEQLIAALTQEDCYIWELPVSSGNKTYTISFSIGQPLNPNVDFTEAEKQQILSRVGKWVITSITADGDQPYIAQAAQTLASSKNVDYDRIYYVTDGMSHCTLAVLSEDGTLTNTFVVAGMLSVTDQRTRAATELTFAPDTIYSYSEVKQTLALAEADIQPGTDGGISLVIRGEPSQSPAVPLVISIVCAAALAAVCVYRKKTA